MLEYDMNLKYIMKYLSFVLEGFVHLDDVRMWRNRF